MVQQSLMPKGVEHTDHITQRIQEVRCSNL